MKKTDFSTSTLYQCFLEEREEILKHKWIESEKAGKDIGFEKALLSWVRNYRESWKESHKPKTLSTEADRVQSDKELYID